MLYVRRIAVALLVCAPTMLLAHSSIDRSDLDDEIVENFPIPVLFGVELPDLVPDFADPRGGGTRSHEGQDMRAPQGTPIVSPTEAIVIKTGKGSSAGNYVYTANPGGETFRYMHLDYIADLDPGDKLDVGDFIGTVGDTGNAPDGVYHLHLEVRDDHNDPQDPYERFSDDGFTVKKKMSFLKDIFRDIRNDDEYAEFLVENFTDDFIEAAKSKYDLPSVIDDALEDTGTFDKLDALEKLRELIASLPTVLAMELKEGDSGPTVVLLQIYLMYTGEGLARDRLLAAGPTGYYGSITSDAVAEYQAQLKLDGTGVYDSATRSAMLKRNELALNLN